MFFFRCNAQTYLLVVTNVSKISLSDCYDVKHIFVLHGKDQLLLERHLLY